MRLSYYNFRMPSSGKRKVNYNRELVKCSLCNKELQKDNFRDHKLRFHANEPSAQFIVINDSKQQKLSFVTKGKSASETDPSPAVASSSASSCCQAETSSEHQNSEGREDSNRNSEEEQIKLWDLGASPGISSPERYGPDLVSPSFVVNFENNNEERTSPDSSKPSFGEKSKIESSSKSVDPNSSFEDRNENETETERLKSDKTSGKKTLTPILGVGLVHSHDEGHCRDGGRAGDVLTGAGVAEHGDRVEGLQAEGDEGLGHDGDILVVLGVDKE